MSDKKNKILKIIECLKIFYGYEIKRIYEKVYKEKISAQYIYKVIKSLIEEGLVVNIFEDEFEGKFSWGSFSKRKFFLYVGKGKTEKSKKIEKECKKYLKNLIKELDRNKLLIVRNIIKNMVDIDGKEEILKEIERLL